MNKAMYCCPICIIKQQTNFGSDLFFISDRFVSTKGDYIHQIIDHQLIPNTIYHFRIEDFDSFNKEEPLVVILQSYNSTIQEISFGRGQFNLQVLGKSQRDIQKHPYSKTVTTSAQGNSKVSKINRLANSEDTISKIGSRECARFQIGYQVSAQTASPSRILPAVPTISQSHSTSFEHVIHPA